MTIRTSASTETATVAYITAESCVENYFDLPSSDQFLSLCVNSSTYYVPHIACLVICGRCPSLSYFYHTKSTIVENIG